jgi:hypothetical protein
MAIIRTLKEIASARSIFSYELDCIVVSIEQDAPGPVFHLTPLCGVSSHRPQRSVANVRCTGVAAGWRVSGTGTSRPQQSVGRIQSRALCSTHPRARLRAQGINAGPNVSWAVALVSDPVGIGPQITARRSQGDPRMPERMSGAGCANTKQPQECKDTEAVNANPEVVKANLKVARTRPRASAPGPRWPLAERTAALQAPHEEHKRGLPQHAVAPRLKPRDLPLSFGFGKRSASSHFSRGVLDSKRQQIRSGINASANAAAEGGPWPRLVGCRITWFGHISTARSYHFAGHRNYARTKHGAYMWAW